MLEKVKETQPKRLLQGVMAIRYIMAFYFGEVSIIQKPFLT